MAYMEALGATSASDWNSTKYPGVCKPTNFQALDIARNLQMQLNRVAQALGLSKIAVDGDIGPGTLRLLAQIKQRGVSNVALLTAPATCSALALVADTVAQGANAEASSRSVPATISQPVPSKPVTIVTNTGVEVSAPPSQQASWSSALPGGGSGGAMSQLLPLFLLGGLAWYLVDGRKKKSSTTVTFSSAAPRRRTLRRRTTRRR